MKKPYVQFSKRIVVAVTVCVTAISTIGLVMTFLTKEMEYGVNIIRTYIEYAMVVFAAYSGNSAVEKWLVHKDHKD